MRPAESPLDQTAAGLTRTTLAPRDVRVSDREGTSCKSLPSTLRSSAARRVMAEKRMLWRRHNMLARTRPLSLRSRRTAGTR